MMGKNTHNHSAPIGGMVVTKIKALIKKEASNEIFKPASEVVNDMLLKELRNAPCSSLPNVNSLQKNPS